jgi:folate-binding protein YgfZ
MTIAQKPIRLSSRSLISVSGPDWRSFLQGLLTQDVDSLALGEIRFGALLTPQGRLINDLFLIGRKDGVWLDVQATQRESLILKLTLYRLRAKVVIEADDTQVSADIGGVTEGLVDPRLPALGRRIYGLADAMDDESAYWDHCRRLGVPGPADWGEDKTYPIEANFDLLNGIDFKKGCFVGQETTSRMKRRGLIKTRMAPVEIEGSLPASGSEILTSADLRAGEVLSGQPGLVMAALRLDRIAGPLTVNGQAAVPALPDWLVG